MLSLVTGTVKSTKDPDSLRRVQVELRGLGNPVVTPWLRLVSPYAGDSMGWEVLPEVGDEVLVAMSAGADAAGMYILGSLFNGKKKPKAPDADGKNDVKQWLTRAGHVLRFTDKSGGEKIELETGDGKLSVVLDQKGGSITITGDKEVTVKSTSKAVVDAREVEIKGASKVAITGNSTVEIKGSASVKIEGAQVQISGMVDLG